MNFDLGGVDRLFEVADGHDAAAAAAVGTYCLQTARGLLTIAVTEGGDIDPDLIFAAHILNELAIASYTAAGVAS